MRRVGPTTVHGVQGLQNARSRDIGASRQNPPHPRPSPEAGTLACHRRPVTSRVGVLRIRTGRPIVAFHRPDCRTHASPFCPAITCSVFLGLDSREHEAGVFRARGNPFQGGHRAV